MLCVLYPGLSHCMCMTFRMYKLHAHSQIRVTPGILNGKENFASNDLCFFLGFHIIDVKFSRVHNVQWGLQVFSYFKTYQVFLRELWWNTIYGIYLQVDSPIGTLTTLKCILKYSLETLLENIGDSLILYGFWLLKRV